MRSLEQQPAVSPDSTEFSTAARPLLHLAVACPRCGAPPALRVTRAMVGAAAALPAQERLGTYRCHRRRCGTIFALPAAAFQGAW